MQWPRKVRVMKMSDATNVRQAQFGRFTQRLEGLSEKLQTPNAVETGQLVHLSGMRLEVAGLRSPIGSRCKIEGKVPIEAEVIGFHGDRLVMMCEGSAEGLRPGAIVTPLEGSDRIPVGPGLLGRVIDGAGRALDGFSPPPSDITVPLQGEPLNPMDRGALEKPLDVGIRDKRGRPLSSHTHIQPPERGSLWPITARCRSTAFVQHVHFSHTFYRVS